MTQRRFDMEDPFYHLLFHPGLITAYTQLRGADTSSVGKAEAIISNVQD